MIYRDLFDMMKAETYPSSIYDKESKTPCNSVNNKIPEIKKVIWNNDACIVLWKDGTKTVVKCQDGDEWSQEVGLMAAFSKKLFGNDNTFNKIINRYCSVYFHEDERIQRALEKLGDRLYGSFENEDDPVKYTYLSGVYEYFRVTPYSLAYTLPAYAKEFVKLANKEFEHEMRALNLELSVVKTKDNTFKIVLVAKKGE